MENRYQIILPALKLSKSFAKFIIRIALFKTSINDEMAQYLTLENLTVATPEHWSFHPEFRHFSVDLLPFFVL